ncbi:MAG: hypothetical protein ACTS2F_30065 [Thainema sp.]
MLSTDELTDAQWQVADAIARQLVLDGTDVNELRKAAAYLRAHLDRENAGKTFFSYLKTLVRNGDQIGHSKRTTGYYESLNTICNQYLEAYLDDAPRMLIILSWAARLVQYYDKGVPTGEIAQPTIQSEREAEIQAVVEANTFKVGQELEAVVTAIRGNKVTYEMLGTIKLTQKEYRQIDNLSEGQKIKVEIIQLREDNRSPKKIKLVQ